MRLILPGLALLLLSACGLKDDLYLPDDAPRQSATEINDAESDALDREQVDDDASNA